jgi:2,3,4,5-tetrahydropyridine-2-carboxylate N-succinyltransferase
MDTEQLEQLIGAAFENRALLEQTRYREAVEQVIEALDKGVLRSASQDADGLWQTHVWLGQAILMYFAIRKMEVHEVGPYEFYDKIPLKRDLAGQKIRVVPPGTVRYGAHLEPGVVLMPGYVNIGAYVGSGTMIDTWATVGSCAQIGGGCHLSGGVGIGGVLEPPGARPVIIEDGCFIGSRAIVVEGMHIEREAVIGAGVVLTSSTKVIDVTGAEPEEIKGHIPARSVVIPGTRMRKFNAGEFGIPCALIIGRRKESTERKTSLNQALRDFGVSV